MFVDESDRGPSLPGAVAIDAADSVRGLLRVLCPFPDTQPPYAPSGQRAACAGRLPDQPARAGRRGGPRPRPTVDPHRGGHPALSLYCIRRLPRAPEALSERAWVRLETGPVLGDSAARVAADLRRS
jgi:hypothetical protein